MDKILNWTNYVYRQALASLAGFSDAAHVQADDLGHLAAVVSWLYGLLAWCLFLSLPSKQAL